MQDTIQPAAPKRKNRLLMVLIVAAVVVLALCAGLFALIFSQVGQIATNDVPAMQKTVDDFIRAGGKSDVAAGYALFAPEAQQQFTQEDVRKMFAEDIVVRPIPVDDDDQLQHQYECDDRQRTGHDGTVGRHRRLR